MKPWVCLRYSHVITVFCQTDLIRQDTTATWSPVPVPLKACHNRPSDSRVIHLFSLARCACIFRLITPDYWSRSHSICSGHSDTFARNNCRIQYQRKSRTERKSLWHYITCSACIPIQVRLPYFQTQKSPPVICTLRWMYSVSFKSYRARWYRSSLCYCGGAACGLLEYGVDTKQWLNKDYTNHRTWSKILGVNPGSIQILLDPFLHPSDLLLLCRWWPSRTIRLCLERRKSMWAGWWNCRSAYYCRVDTNRTISSIDLGMYEMETFRGLWYEWCKHWN